MATKPPTSCLVYTPIPDIPDPRYCCRRVPHRLDLMGSPESPMNSDSKDMYKLLCHKQSVPISNCIT